MVDEESEAEKPQEPYRRMLTENIEDVPITPRKRLMNFKIPHVTRTSHRRETVVASRRRLYDDEERERQSSEGEERLGLSNCYAMPWCASIGYVRIEPGVRRRPSLFSDISSEDLSSYSEETSESELVGFSRGYSLPVCVGACEFVCAL